MKQTEAKSPQMNIYKKTIVIMASVYCLLFILMVLLYVTTKYMPIILLAITSSLPVFVNIVLILPKSHIAEIRKKTSLDENRKTCAGEKNKTKNKDSDNFLIVFFKKCNNFYVKYRSIILSIIITVLITLINIFFWMMVGKSPDIKKFSYLIPILVACFWVASVVFEKLCKHVIENAYDDAQVSNKDEIKYEEAVLKSMRSGFFISAVSALIVFVESIFNVLAIGDITKYLNVVLYVIFGYETVFLLISLCVRLIRKELAHTPELTIPIPGIGGRDLGIIAYLENNTGISMRSLWSIKLISRIVPVAALAIIVLLWSFSGVVKIDAHQQGVHYRFGKLQEEILQPGLHFELPWLIDSVDIYDVGVVNRMTIGYESDDDADNMWNTQHDGEEYKLLLGGGNEVVSINLRVEYKIKDLKAYIKYNSWPEKMLQASAYEVITHKIISTDIVSLLSSDMAQLSEELRFEITDRVAKYNTGLEVVSVILESIHPPVEVAEIYQQAISAGIKAEEIILNAKAEAEVLKIRAESKKIEGINIEKQYAFDSYSEAQSVCTEFLACVEAYKNNPGNNAPGDNNGDYKYQKYIQAMREAYSHGKLIILGEGVNGKNVIYIGDLIVSSGQAPQY